MLDIKFIKENLDRVKSDTENRGIEVNFDKLLELDETRRAIIQDLQDMREERNERSSEGKPSEKEIKELRELSNDIDELENSLKNTKEKYIELLKQIPNITDPDSPVGPEENFNVLEKNNEPKDFDFEPKTHLELMEELDLIDFERGAKVTGSDFYFTKKDLVELNEAVIQYASDIVKEYDFDLMETPDMAKNEMIENAGFNPRGEESQIYNVEGTDFSLVGTAEITVLGYHSDEIIDLEDGPKKYAAISHCFRREAGAYGKSSKGLYRVHQFKKLELFVFCKPENSEKLHKELLEIEKKICDGLDLPYRVIDIATEDLGAPAYKKFDIESWMTMKSGENDQGGYGEITSCSNCTNYQARRANIRYKNEDGENKFVHTLNGTAVVSSRVPIAIFENYQKEDGAVQVPEVLQKYMGKKEIK